MSVKLRIPWTFYLFSSIFLTLMNNAKLILHRFGAKFGCNYSGITFNSHMDDFSFPNIISPYGVEPSPNNYIKPYKRPMSSMVPTIVVIMLS